jgi:hypothetical protein
MHNFTARIACVILALGFADGLVGAWLYRYTPVPPSALVFGIACIFFVFLMVSGRFRFAVLSTRPALIDGGRWLFDNCNPILSFPNSRLPERLYRDAGICLFDAGVHAYGCARAPDGVGGPVLTGDLSDRGPQLQ